MYRLRFPLVILGCFLRPTRGLFDTFELRFLAWPFLDTDVSRLFTQTYASWMGLCRWNFLFSSPFRGAALKRGWAPVTTRETIEYRRAIRWLARVTVSTRMLGWTARRFYLEQSFHVRGELHARCVVEGVIRGRGGAVEPAQAFRELGYEGASPELPAEVRAWAGG